MRIQKEFEAFKKNKMNDNNNKVSASTKRNLIGNIVNHNTPQRDGNDLLIQNQEIKKREKEIEKLRKEIQDLKNQKKSLSKEGKVRVEILTKESSLEMYRLTTSSRYSKTPELFLRTVYTKSLVLLKKGFSVIGSLGIKLINTQSLREEIPHHIMVKSKYPILDENDKYNYLNSLPNYFLEKIAHPNLEGSGWRQNGVNFFDLKLVKIR